MSSGKEVVEVGGGELQSRRCKQVDYRVGLVVSEWAMSFCSGKRRMWW